MSRVFGKLWIGIIGILDPNAVKEPTCAFRNLTQYVLPGGTYWVNPELENLSFRVSGMIRFS